VKAPLVRDCHTQTLAWKQAVGQGKVVEVDLLVGADRPVFGENNEGLPTDDRQLQPAAHGDLIH
jgi:hypothetical protein